MLLRDPVFGLVSFEAEEEDIVPRLLCASEVQRLRRIRQLGVTSLAFPGAEHTRFSHALGAAFVMKKFIARLRALEGSLPYWQRITSDRAREALAAALLHDVGHGPLSHSFEGALPGMPKHEAFTEQILLDPDTDLHRALQDIDSSLPRRVAALVRGEHELPYLARAVSGQLDVDRCDYLLRDAHSTGVDYGRFDLDWLLRSLCVIDGAEGGGPTLAVDGAKGLHAVEAFFLARLFMFQQVYLHKATRAAEWMIQRIVSRAFSVLSDGTALPLACDALRSAARGKPISLREYLELDDTALYSMMRAWESGPDAVLADLCRRFRLRTLHKTLELFEGQTTDEGALSALSTAREIAKRRGFDPEHYVGIDRSSVSAYETDAESLRVVYAKGQPRLLSKVSFVLGRLSDQRLTRLRLVFAPELRDEIASALLS